MHINPGRECQIGTHSRQIGLNSKKCFFEDVERVILTTTLDKALCELANRSPLGVNIDQMRDERT